MKYLRDHIKYSVYVILTFFLQKRTKWLIFYGEPPIFWGLFVVIFLNLGA